MTDDSDEGVIKLHYCLSSITAVNHHPLLLLKLQINSRSLSGDVRMSDEMGSSNHSNEEWRHEIDEDDYDPQDIEILNRYFLIIHITSYMTPGIFYALNSCRIRCSKDV